MSNNDNKKKLVFVGLSGGVDSAVAAHLLIGSGYKVTGVFMKNWSGITAGVKCPWEEDYNSARQVAAHLSIELKLYDFEKQYRQTVGKYLIETYTAGLTPNPDIMCNEEIKFKAFFQKCLEEGADFIATGHYVRIGWNSWQISSSDAPVFASHSTNYAPPRASHLPQISLKDSSLNIHADFNADENMNFNINKNNKPLLLRAKDRNKDQTYFLYRVSCEALSKSIFPLGELTKSEVRKIAHEIKLPNANRPDSVGICFVGPVPMKGFLHEFIEYKTGDVVDEVGDKVGQHDGVFFYTIGQRHGLGIGGGKPYFVYDKDVKNNILYVTTNPNSVKLNKKEFIISNCIWRKSIVDNEEYLIQVRYRSAGVTGRIKIITNDEYKIILNNPERAISPGQSAVIYDGDIVMGGGIIK